MSLAKGPTAASAQPGPSPRVGRPAVRRLLDAILISDTDFSGFCLDYFPEIHKEFSDGMSRQRKTNLLLERATPEAILAALREGHAEAVRANEGLLQPRGVLEDSQRLGALLAGALLLAAGCGGLGSAWLRGHLTGRSLILGGTFQMGSTDKEVRGLIQLCRELHGAECRPDVFEREAPAQKMQVSSFWLDVREVDNRSVASWLSGLRDLEVRDDVVYQGGVALLRMPAGDSPIAFQGGRFAARADRVAHPATSVTWAGARRYCASRGMRLPTEAEWEFAARGSEQRTFPWGEGEPRCGGMVFGRGPGGLCADSPASPAPAGSAPDDVTPQGVRDLAGNVAEWVADAFEERYRTCNGICVDAPQDVRDGDGKDRERVIRGGYFSARTEELRSSARGKTSATRSFRQVGFRCARSGVLCSD